MINKSKLWFLTLSSIILVLAIYYIAIPQDNSSFVFSDNKENTNIVTNIEESEALTAMRINKEEEHLASLQVLQEVLLSTDKNVDEKNEAYEKIKYLNDNKALEEKLENMLKDEFKLSAFVQIKDNNLKVVIANKEKSYTGANDIISFINNNTNNTYYVTVKYE